MEKDPIRTSLCPYCQTILWFSVGAVLCAPLILLCLFYIGIFRGLFWVINLLLNAPYQHVQTTADYQPRKLTTTDKLLNDVWDKLEDMAASNAFEKIIIAFVTTLCVLGVLLIGYVLKIGIVQFFSAAIPWLGHEIPLIPSQIWHVALTLGCGFYYIFQSIGDGLFIIKGGITTGATYAWTEIVWFFTNAVIWKAVGVWTLRLIGFMIASVFLGYCFHEVNTSDWMKTRKLAAEDRAHQRKLRQRERDRLRRMAEIEREQETERASVALENIQQKEKPKVVKPPKGPSWLFLFCQNIKRNLLSYSEPVGVVSYKMVGIFPMLGTFLWGLKKGVCPMVTFLTPDELVAMQKKADEEMKARLAARLAEIAEKRKNEAAAEVQQKLANHDYADSPPHTYHKSDNPVDW